MPANKSQCAEEICVFPNVGRPYQRKGTEYHGKLHDISIKGVEGLSTK